MASSERREFNQDLVETVTTGEILMGDSFGDPAPVPFSATSQGGLNKSYSCDVTFRAIYASWRG